MSTQTPLEIAIAEQQAAKKRADDLAKYIQLQQAANSLAIDLGLSSAPTETTETPRQENTIVQPKQSVRDAIRTIAADQIAKAGPQKTKDIVDLVLASGVEFNASNKIIAVSQALSGQPQFVPSRKNGWSLAESDQLKEESPANVVATNDNGGALNVQSSPIQGA